MNHPCLSNKWKKLRKLLLGVAGGTVLCIGIIMLVLPGPACLVIPLGLGILATEFDWARRVRDRGLIWVKQKRQRAEDWGRAAISGRFIKRRTIVTRKGR